MTKPIIIEHPNEVVLVQHVAGDNEQVLETADGSQAYREATALSPSHIDAFNAQWNRQLQEWHE